MTCPKCGEKKRGYSRLRNRELNQKIVFCDKCNAAVWIDGNKEKELRKKSLLK